MCGYTRVHVYICLPTSTCMDTRIYMYPAMRAFAAVALRIFAFTYARIWIHSKAAAVQARKHEVQAGKVVVEKTKAGMPQ